MCVWLVLITITPTRYNFTLVMPKRKLRYIEAQPIIKGRAGIHTGVVWALQGMCRFSVLFIPIS